MKVEFQMRDPHGSWLTRFSFDSPYIDGHFPRPAAVSFFCPQCGDTWARYVYSGFKHCQSLYRRCEHHGGGFILCDLVPVDLTQVASEWLKREFVLASADPSSFERCHPL